MDSNQTPIHKSFLLQNHFNYLFHISDIHIRNSEDRQDEFKLQFTRTFNHIKLHPKFHKDTSLIIVTGDILDKGIRMTAIAIELLQLFVDGLTTLCSTIIIPGNHDDKKDVGLSRLDSLTAVFNESRQQRTNLYYLKSSGIYLFGDNIAFGHTSVIDKQFIKASDINDSNRTKIALFHGLVGVSSSSSSNNTYNILNNYDFYIDDFNGYDKVLLGDVHKVQKVGNEHCWYAGSLIQKSFSEDRRQHGGLLVWNINSNDKPEYIHIQNNHEFIILNIENGDITGEACEATGAFHLRNNKPFEISTLPKKTSIRFKCDKNTTHAHLDNITQQLNNNTTIIEESRVWTDFHHVTNNKKEEREKEPLSNIDPLERYVTNNFPDNIQSLTELDKEYKTKHNVSSLDANTNYGKWTLLELSMENIYNYQEKHTLCFKKLPHDIISIHGKNGSGKSKLVESIILALYGCGPKHVPHIVSHGKNNATTSLTIQLNNDIYIINRTFKWNPNKSCKSNKTSIQIIKNNEDNTATDKYESEKSIERLFGTKQDLCDTHISKQGCHLDFIHKKEQDQLAFLKRLFNTSIYETIEKTVKQDISQLKKEVKQKQLQLEKYGKKDITQLNLELETLQQEITPLTQKKSHLLQTHTENTINIEKHKNLSNIIKELTLDITDKKKELIDNLDSKLEIKDKQIKNKTTLDTLKNDLLAYRNQIETLYEKKHPITPSLIDDIKLLETKIIQLEQEISKLINIIDQDNKQSSYIVNKIKKYKSRLDVFQQQKCNTLEKLDNNRKWTFSSLQAYTLELKKQNNTNIDKDKDKDSISVLNNDIKAYEARIRDHDISTLDKQYKKYNKYLLEQQQTNLHIKDTLKKIKNIKNDLTKDRFSYQDSCKSCQHNKTINLIPEKLQDLDKLKSELNELNENIIIINNYLQEHPEIPQLYLDNTAYNTNISRHNILVEQLKKHEIYQQLKQEEIEYKNFIKQRDLLNTLQNSIQQTQEKEKGLQEKQISIETKTQENKELLEKYKLELQTQNELLKVHVQEQLFIKDNDKLQLEIDELHKKISTVETNSSNIQKNNKELEKMLVAHLANNTIIQYLKEKETLVELRKQELDVIVIIQPLELVNKITHLDNKLDQLKDKIRLKQNEIQQEQDNIDKQHQLTIELETLEYDLELLVNYLKITQEFPIHINKTGINQLEILINQYLWNMTCFNIKIISTDNSVEFIRNDPDKSIPIEYCSGFEKFAISLAIRLAFAKIHPFNSMNSLIIDEGFGVFDSHNLKRLPNMLETLKPLFRQIFIITHIDELQSELTHKIMINTDKITGYPVIINTDKITGYSTVR